MTDSRHYNDLAGGRVYRFCPYRFTRSTIQLVHGVDERIAGAGGWNGFGGCNGCRPRLLLSPAASLTAAAAVLARAAGAAEPRYKCLLISPGPACLPAVDDFLRGIRFYSRIFDLATSDEGSEEAAAAAAAAAAGATAAA